MALIKDAADAAERERAAAMPNPVTAARRGITVGRYMQLSERQAAIMVMTAASAAAASAAADGCEDTSWLGAIHAEAERVYLRTRPKPTLADPFSHDSIDIQPRHE